jgi:hypothetical protein
MRNADFLRQGKGPAHNAWHRVEAIVVLVQHCGARGGALHRVGFLVAARIKSRAGGKVAGKAARVLESVGGTEIQILSFYVKASTITGGKTAQICYGVANTKSVRIEPGGGAT